MTLTGRVLGEELRAGPWLWDLMDQPTPHTLRVKGPRPWIDPTHPFYGVRLGTGQSTAVRSRNRAACQAAIDDAQTEGGAVYIPGVVEINANLTMAPSDSAPFYMRGALWQRSKLLFIGNFGLRVNGTYANIHMSHLTLDCSGGGTTNNYGLYTTGSVSSISMEKVWFESGFNIGLFAEDTYHVNLRRVFFEGLNGIVAQRDNSDQIAQWMLDECHFNASNGVQALKVVTGGEIYIVRTHFVNYLSDNSVAGSPLSEATVYLKGCASVTFDTCTFEGNDPNTISGRSADVLLENCGTIKFDNPKMVTAGGVHAIKHDFIKVQGTGGLGNGCASLIINGADINGAFLAGRLNYFVNWDSGTGRISVQAPVNQTQAATEGVIPLLTGAAAPTGVSYQACFPAKTSDTTVGNTTNETTVYTASVAANEFFAGRRLETRLSGYFSSAAAPDQATIRLKVNGVTVATATTPTAAIYTTEPIYIEGSATVRTFAVEQEERFSVTGTVTAAGNLEVVVTAAGMAGTPVTVTVAVALNDTAAQVAKKIRTELAANANVSGFFSVNTGATAGNDASMTGTNVAIKALAAAANDATMNMALSSVAPCAGIDAVVTSTNSVAGVAGAVMADLKVLAANVASSENNTATTAVDVSAGGDVTVTVQWNAAAAGTTMTITQGTTRD